MKTWQKIVAMVALVGLLGLMGFTVVAGWGANQTGAAKNITLGLDLAGGASITFQAVDDVTLTDMEDVLNKMTQRVEDYDGATAYLEGTNRVTVEIPGVDDAESILKELGKPGSLSFILQKTTDGETENYTTGYIKDDDGNIIGYGTTLARTLEEIEADGCVILTGSDIVAAEGVYQSASQSSQKEPVVSFQLNDEGTKKFADATTVAYKNGWSIGVYYDGEFISVPTVTSEIKGGQGQITGMESLEAAQKLASYIRIGAMNTELEMITAQVVGASLGQEAIKTSLIAGAIGLAILFIFMIAYYRIPGIAADIALLCYTGLMLLILNVFDLSLSLPGIAGIILGIGMAVDANVIIYARIREEIATGRPVRSSIQVGFRKALSAILDGNITTLIAAIILGIFGSGAIRSFALTLGIGIVLSMFTSLLVARWVILLLYHLGCKKVSLYGTAKERKTINIVSKKKIWFSISALVIATGVVFLVVNNASGNGIFNFELEFTGGESTSVTLDGEYNLAKVDSEVIPIIKEATGVTNVTQQIVNGNDKTKTTVIFKTQQLGEEQRAALAEAFKSKLNVNTADANAYSYTVIGGSISSESRTSAIIAVVIATVCMLLYIAVRFRDVRFALSSIIALLHDVLIVLAFYAISRTGVGNTFIACMLTIVGYSINATIVIFDRVRENMKVMTKSTLSEVVNSSITSTMVRSINTSLTTFIMVLVLYIVGVDSIRAFAAPIMVGIIAGAYSSVFISGSLWYVMKKSAYKKAKKKLNS